MKVLSLFDGISCGRVALQRAGIKVDQYSSSEVCKFAIKIARQHWRNRELGPVESVKNEDCDLLIGGSPCQGFSFTFANKLDFHDPRSQLFFEYERVLKESRPKWFLLENVRMDNTSENIISDRLGIKPTLINSADFSPQFRERLYWTNIPIRPYHTNTQTIKDIMQNPNSHDVLTIKRGVYDPNYAIKKGNTPLCCGRALDIKGHDILKRVYSKNGKSPTLTTEKGGNQHKKVALDHEKYRVLTPLEYERLQTLPDNYTRWVSPMHRYSCVGNGWTVDVIAHILGGIK